MPTLTRWHKSKLRASFIAGLGPPLRVWEALGHLDTQGPRQGGLCRREDSFHYRERGRASGLLQTLLLSTKGLGSAVVRSGQSQGELGLVTWLQQPETFQLSASLWPSCFISLASVSSFVEKFSGLLFRENLMLSISRFRCSSWAPCGHLNRPPRPLLSGSGSISGCSQPFGGKFCNIFPTSNFLQNQIALIQTLQISEPSHNAKATNSISVL